MIHLIPTSFDLVSLTFLTEFLPFSSLAVSRFLCFLGLFQFTWVLDPFGLAMRSLIFLQLCRQQLGLLRNKHSLFPVALQANTSAAFSRSPFQCLHVYLISSTWMVAVQQQVLQLQVKFPLSDQQATQSWNNQGLFRKMTMLKYFGTEVVQCPALHLSRR